MNPYSTSALDFVFNLLYFTICQVWQFSSRFSTVDAWHFRDIPPMSEHLKVCPYYETEARSKRVFLPCISEDTHKPKHCKGLKLVNMFQKTTIF